MPPQRHAVLRPAQQAKTNPETRSSHGIPASRQGNQEPPKPANPAGHTVPAFAIFPIHTIEEAETEKRPLLSTDQPPHPARPSQGTHAGRTGAKQASSRVRPHACLVGSSRMGNIGSFARRRSMKCKEGINGKH
jgi:hypothetical protein